LHEGGAELDDGFGYTHRGRSRDYRLSAQVLIKESVDVTVWATLETFLTKREYDFLLFEVI
jgi:mRNA-degrading endonuclease RelE of RelBE toxin-antitoxin system